MYKILVIEDDPVIREELAALLRADGYQVTEDLPCDLALLDINLPGRTGSRSAAGCESIRMCR